MVNDDVSLFLRCSYEGCDYDGLAMCAVSGFCCALCPSLFGVLLLRVPVPSSAVDVRLQPGHLPEVPLLLSMLQFAARLLQLFWVRAPHLRLMS